MHETSTTFLSERIRNEQKTRKYEEIREKKEKTLARTTSPSPVLLGRLLPPLPAADTLYRIASIGHSLHVRCQDAAPLSGKLGTDASLPRHPHDADVRHVPPQEQRLAKAAPTWFESIGDFRSYVRPSRYFSYFLVFLYFRSPCVRFLPILDVSTQ